MDKITNSADLDTNNRNMMNAGPKLNNKLPKNVT